jgi:dTDP-4-amino-4,6-dideoxygalactose transaminase
MLDRGLDSTYRTTSMGVPYIDLAQQYRAIKSEVDRSIAEVIEQSDFVIGRAVAQFEREFATYCGTEHCIGVNNGTMALHLCLRALDVGPGDEVIAPAHTFIATIEAIAHTGARPVLIDVESDSCNMDPSLIERAITDKTRAVVPVHLYGHLAGLESIGEICRQNELYLIEDAAQAHGARRGGKKAGAYGIAGAFSFYPAKNLGAFGDAGAVVTSERALADLVRKLRDHGSSRRHVHEIPGFNARLGGLQAAVLNIKLKYLDDWNDRRIEVARWYAELLSDCPLDLPGIPTDGSHVFHLYVVRCDRRDELREYLRAQDIVTQIHYPTPPHLQRAFAGLGYGPGTFPVTEQICDQVLSLPIFPEVTREQVATVASHIGDFFARSR